MTTRPTPQPGALSPGGETQKTPSQAAAKTTELLVYVLAVCAS